VQCSLYPGGFVEYAERLKFPDRIDAEKALTGFFYARKVRNPKLNVS
jgi:hypothetical protein